MTVPPPPGEYPPLPPSGEYYPPPPPPYYGPEGGYRQPQPTNGMAIASMVFAFLFAPLGILFGHISLSQIKRSGQEGRPEEGHGLAVAGLVISYLFTVFAAIVMVAVIVLGALAISITDDLADLYPSFPSDTASPLPETTLPPFDPPATLGSNCQYPATTEAASKPYKPPRTGRVPTTPATVDATLVTDDGAIGLRLDNAKSPCTVNNFVSLAQQGYFDDTPCHRLTTSAAMGVLQCGDPTGKGTGGPGYRFPNEYPTNQYRMSDPALQQPIRYPRGTLAMANAGPGTNGSQFFLVYQDSILPPTYTVFGVIDEKGLAVVDEIAAAAVADGTDDGPPKNPVTIKTVRLD
jgi:peptidyl-prolyl cis-trans isomerase B (cyclophilin B)